MDMWQMNGQCGVWVPVIHEEKCNADVLEKAISQWDIEMVRDTIDNTMREFCQSYQVTDSVRKEIQV